jgi:hypothetical protein
MDFQQTLTAHGGLQMKEQKDMNLGLANYWEVVCHDSNGVEKWREKNKNLVTTAGADMILETALDGQTQITAWFVGLKNAGTAVIADTMASHGTWTEIVHTTKYSETVRQTLTLGSVTGTTTSSIDNVGNLATFSINATSTVAGAFIVSNNATSSATTGELYGVVDFGSARGVISGDTLTVTVTLTAKTA